MLTLVYVRNICGRDVKMAAYTRVEFDIFGRGAKWGIIRQVVIKANCLSNKYLLCILLLFQKLV